VDIFLWISGFSSFTYSFWAKCSSKVSSRRPDFFQFFRSKSVCHRLHEVAVKVSGALRLSNPLAPTHLYPQLLATGEGRIDDSSAASTCTLSLTISLSLFLACLDSYLQDSVHLLLKSLNREIATDKSEWRAPPHRYVFSLHGQRKGGARLGVLQPSSSPSALHLKNQQIVKIALNWSRKMIPGSRDPRTEQNCAPNPLEDLPEARNL